MWYYASVLRSVVLVSLYRLPASPLFCVPRGNGLMAHLWIYPYILYIGMAIPMSDDAITHVFGDV